MEGILGNEGMPLGIGGRVTLGREGWVGNVG